MTGTDHESGQLIALVRHGETEWNRQRLWQGRQGAELNDTGRQHAATAARTLGDLNGWSWMISSPATRACQTAGIIAASLEHSSVTVDEELVEQDLGIADGMPIAEADARWPDRDYPGKEPRETVAKRGTVALERILSEHPGDGIVVAHGALIRITLAALVAQDMPRILNGAVSTIRRAADGWQLVEVNRTC